MFALNLGPLQALHFINVNQYVTCGVLDVSGGELRVTEVFKVDAYKIIKSSNVKC